MDEPPADPSTDQVQQVLTKLARLRPKDVPPREIDPDQIPYDIYVHQRADLAQIANRHYICSLP